VLVAALGLSPGRVERAGRAAATDTPRLSKLRQGVLDPVERAERDTGPVAEFSRLARPAESHHGPARRLGVERHHHAAAP